MNERPDSATANGALEGRSSVVATLPSWRPEPTDARNRPAVFFDLPQAAVSPLLALRLPFGCTAI